MSGGLIGLEPPGQGRLNKKMICIDTGANIAAIPLTHPATVFVCNETGSGYKVDQMYITRADGSGRSAVQRAHNHSTSSDEDGGDIYDIDVANSGTRLSLGNPRLVVGGAFVVTTESTPGTPADATRIQNTIGTNSKGMQLLTTANSADRWTQVEDGGLGISFSNRIQWRIKMQISHAGTDVITWRTGVNMEAISAAGTGTENRFGMEGCSATDGFIHLICSNGGGVRTNANTNIGTQTNMAGYKMSYTPGTNIIWQDSSGTIQTLSSNIPSSGVLQSDRTLRYGVRKASGTVEKKILIAADSLYGKIGDPLWVT